MKNSRCHPSYFRALPAILTQARNRKLDVQADGGSLQGLQRHNNQDNYAINLDQQLFVVADGMGSREWGHEASRLAVDTIQRSVAQSLEYGKHDHREVLRTAFVQANDAVVNDVRRHPNRVGMGSTAAAVWVDGAKLFVAGIGDSRVYLIRKDSVHQLTVDHTMAQLYVDQGILKSEEVNSSRWRHVLWQCLGNEEQFKPPDVLQKQLQPGDRLLLCSDGLSNYLDSDELLKVLNQCESHVEASQSMLAQVARRKGKDDATVVVVRVAEPG